MTMVDQALQVEPSRNVDAYAQLARLLLRQNRVDEALQAALAAYQRQSTDPETQLVLAAVLAAKGQDEQVLLLIEAALGHRADYAEALALRAMVRLRRQDLTAALADIERCLTIKPHLSQVWSLVALLCHQFGHLSEAIAALQRALSYDPGHVDSMIDLGDYYRQDGDVFVALTWLQKAVAMAPSNARAWASLARALQQCQRVAEARDAYVKALELAPQQADSAYQLAVLAQSQENWQQALRYLDQVLAYQPDCVATLVSKAKALRALQRQQEAEAVLARVLQRCPDGVETSDAETALVLAQLLLARNDNRSAGLALNHVMQALNNSPSDEAQALFVQCMQRWHGGQVSPPIDDCLVRALSEPWCRPTDLAMTASRIVVTHPVIHACVARSNRTWPLRLSTDWLYGGDGLQAVSRDELLKALLVAAPVASVELEQLFTLARWQLLDSASRTDTANTGHQDPVLDFYSALARQCFINDYCFSLTDAEIARAQALQQRLQQALSTGATIPAVQLLAVAAYGPLYSLPQGQQLLERAWPQPVMAVLVQQLVEPAEESQLRATIATLTRVGAEPSSAPPAPHWLKPEPVVPRSLPRSVPQGEPQNILVVGCKTGQSAVAMACQFPAARIKAVDLSLANLAYAKRKTRQLGLDAIEYLQADPLQLGLLNRTFDIIAVADALDHLTDPATGWRILLALLRPGGVMQLQSPHSSLEAFLRATPQLALLADEHADERHNVWLQRL
ncbi:MAG: tetratricopeptide repeat protein [Magnetococcales bacterium]|nr:tetratricopeptide repeat protein [Magnetococcales bacterium]